MEKKLGVIDLKTKTKETKKSKEMNYILCQKTVGELLNKIANNDTESFRIGIKNFLISDFLNTSGNLSIEKRENSEMIALVIDIRILASFIQILFGQETIDNVVVDNSVGIKQFIAIKSEEVITRSELIHTLSNEQISDTNILTMFGDNMFQILIKVFNSLKDIAENCQKAK